MFLVADWLANSCGGDLGGPGRGAGRHWFQQLAAANHHCWISKATTGDTVTVKAGIYREVVALKNGYLGQPFTLRAMPGQRVVVSGLPPVSGWALYQGGIYTTTVSFAARDLFVGYQPQRIAFCG